MDNSTPCLLEGILRELITSYIFMSEGIPVVINQEGDLKQDPAIEMLRRELQGVELNEANIRSAINTLEQDLADELSVETDPEKRKELTRRRELFINRGNDIIDWFLPSAETVE